MINSEFRKEMADSWFSYLQNQICKEFETIENGKKNLLNVVGVKKITKKVEEYLLCYPMEIFLKKLE